MSLDSSWLDIMLILMLAGSIGLGFTQGLLRQVILLVAMYVGTVVSAQYNGFLAHAIQVMVPGSSGEMATLIAFILVSVAFTLVFTAVFWRTYRDTHFPSVPMADEVGGALLGGVIGIFAIGLTLMMANYALQVPWPEGSPIKQALHVGVNHGSVQTVLSAPLPLIHGALRPWLPEALATLVG